MKKTLIVSLVMILVGGILSSSALASVRLKGGYFMPGEKYVMDGGSIPENGIFLGAEMSTTLTGGIVGLGSGVDYFQSSKTIGDEEGTWQVIPALATLYFYPWGSLYLGAGIGYYMVYFKVTPAWPEGDTVIGGGLGYHGVIGYGITDYIFVEGKYSTCTVNTWELDGISIISEISEVGGISLALGFSV